MEYHTNTTVHGFRVLKDENCADPEGRAVLMEHERTGARLFWLDNGAENMVFSITFRTLPEDSSGVFHIVRGADQGQHEHVPECNDLSGHDDVSGIQPESAGPDEPDRRVS